MKKLLGLSLVAWLLLLSGCAITHEYGPYMGKVVEKGTGEPIEGAVVFLKFDTVSGSIGGPVSHEMDAVETVTDVKGEFLVPRQAIYTFRALQGWGEHAYVIIFKPGYGAFPGHHETVIKPTITPHWAIPENIPVYVQLPKLKTNDERRENLGHLWVGRSDAAILAEMTRQERINIGLKP